MDTIESTLRAIKDRIDSSLGEIDEAAYDASNKENYRRLTFAARSLHHCADEIQNILMRIKPK